MKLSFLLLLLLAGPGLAGEVQAADLKWQPFISDAGRFSVEMLGHPTCTEKDAPSPLGPVRENLFSVECGQIVLDAEYSVLPNIAALFGGRPRIYREVIDEFFKRTPAKEIAVEPFVLDAYHGRVLTYETSARFGKLWMLLISRRLYVLHASVPKAYPDRSVIDYFFSTFKPMYRPPKEVHSMLMEVGQSPRDAL